MVTLTVAAVVLHRGQAVVTATAAPTTPVRARRQASRLLACFPRRRLCRSHMQGCPLAGVPATVQREVVTAAQVCGCWL